MQLVFSILNALGLVGLAIFLHFLFSGLQKRIENLKTLAEEQKQTLGAVRERAEEFDKLSKGYKQALSDFQEMGEKLEVRRTQLVKELEDANLRKDAEIVKLKELELEEIEIKKKSFDRLPDLEAKLQSLVLELERQVKIIEPSSLLYSRLVNRHWWLRESPSQKTVSWQIANKWPSLSNDFLAQIVLQTMRKSKEEPKQTRPEPLADDGKTEAGSD